MDVKLADIEKQIRDVELGLDGQMSMKKGGYELAIQRSLRVFLENCP